MKPGMLFVFKNRNSNVLIYDLVIKGKQKETKIFTITSGKETFLESWDGDFYRKYCDKPENYDYTRVFP